MKVCEFLHLETKLGFLNLSHLYSCAYSHTCTQSHTHKRAHTHPHISPRTHALTHTHICPQASTHTHTFAPHPHTHTHTFAPHVPMLQKTVAKFSFRRKILKEVETFRLRPMCRLPSAAVEWADIGLRSRDAHPARAED